MYLYKIDLRLMVSIKWPSEAENLMPLFVRSARPRRDSEPFQWVELDHFCEEMGLLVTCTWLFFTEKFQEESGDSSCVNLSISTPA